MKKIILFFLFITLLNCKLPVLAVESTVSGTPKPTATLTPILSVTPSSELKIQELKEKLASRVAQLSSNSPKLVKGEIKTLSDEKIVIGNEEGELNLSLSEDTVIQTTSAGFVSKTVKLDSLKSGLIIYGFGPLNSATNTLTAKKVTYLEPAENLIGKIKSVDADNYQLTVIYNNQEMLIDHQVTTKDLLFDVQKGIVKSGFSKFKEGQYVYVVGTKDTTKDGKPMISALRITIVPNESITPSTTPSITPTNK